MSEINWPKVKTKFKKLKTVQKYRKRIADKTADLWTPQHLPTEEATYFFLLSDRARGKTNQILLLLMIAAYDYDKRIEYVRTTDDEIAPKNTGGLFDIICAHDYIDIITGGKYNTVQYSAKYWYYAKNENGKITDIAEKPFMHLSCVRKYLDLKSGYNSDNSDLILYDEMIGKEEPEDFERYMQLQSTFFRIRQKCKVFFVSNTIKKDAQIFYEFTIAKPIEKMQQGDSKIIKNQLGTAFYVEILSSDKSQTKRIVNSEYYGFDNPKLASITGAHTWAFKQYQHIPRLKHVEYITKNIYVYYHGKYYRCDIVSNELGICVYCHRATKTYTDSIIFTLEDITDSRYIFALGQSSKHLKFWKLLKANRWYFADNEIGDSIERYFTTAKRT